MNFRAVGGWFRVIGWIGYGLMLCCGVSPGSRAATPAPARIGEYDVDLEFMCSGSSSGSSQDATGSGSWSDEYSFHLTSRVTYEVLQKGTNAYTGSQLRAGSTLSVSGGGRSSASDGNGHSFATEWSYRPASGFDSTRAYASGGYYSSVGKADASTGYRPTLVLAPSDAAAVTDGFAAAEEAADGVGTSFSFDVPLTIEGWARSGSHATNVSHHSTVVSASSQGSATCTVNVQYRPDGLPQWEAILEPGPPFPTAGNPAYEDWLPLGSLKEASDFPGNSLMVRVRLQAAGGGPGIPPKAKYKFYLSDVSREPGVLMNFPAREAKGCATTPDGPFDLKIYPGDPLKVSDDGQSAETLTSQKTATVAVASYDFGSYGKLKVVAETDDGQTVVAHLDGKSDETILVLPLDANQNHVADVWEKQFGVYERNLPPEWDGVDQPEGHAVKGDGLSLYERYRGFLVLNGVGKEVFERLDPGKKFLFVRNPDRLVQQVFSSPEGRPESYEAVSECEVRYISANGWTGPGTFADRKRVVNFNCSEDKHAVDQHALHIVIVTSANPVPPKDVDDLRARFGLEPEAPLDRGTEGSAYRDESAPEQAQKEWRPAANYRTEIYAAAIKYYVGLSVLYHTGAACPGCTVPQAENEAWLYLLGHPAEAGRKQTIELSATLAHEMGHGTGIQHHDPETNSPTDNTLKNCTMRYYTPWEFPRDPADRFELSARGNNPDSLCRRIHNCWGQVKISDNLKAAKGAEAELAEAPAKAARPRNLAVAGFVPPIPIPETTAYELSADLVWDDAMAGDPLRFCVRLHGLNDSVAENWLDGLSLRLLRMTPDNRTEEVLGPAAWPPFLRENAFEPMSLGIPNVSRVAEWLVPADRAGLTSGQYRLEISWNGRGLAPDKGLPTNGVVSLAPMEIAVDPTDTSVRMAIHRRHLAWERYSLEDLAGAVAHVQEAERLDPDGRDPLAIQTRMVGISSAARLGDALGTARFLEDARRGASTSNDHVGGMALAALGTLAPRLEWEPAPAGPGGTGRFQVSGFPGGTFVVERTTDLRTWTPVSTNTPATGAYSVVDPGGLANQFYRVVWQK